MASWLGNRVAELAELPVMLLCCWWLAGWLVRHFTPRRSQLGRRNCAGRADWPWWKWASGLCSVAKASWRGARFGRFQAMV
ncbi:hypothetical protein [Gallaecimonas sp. GXIMD1310]|uniref:hypothetical protein n=1 Tax=Gallaecimonas sp. GXIMD1310 TaxID=3131926 RepID=UPI003248D85C